MQDLARFELPGLVNLQTGHGGLPKVQVTTRSSTAEIYLHGAQVTAFQKIGEAPLLFLSERSHFTAQKAIRGGIPICAPWFGPRPGEVSHGFARISEWILLETAALADGAQLRLQLPPRRGPWESLTMEVTLTITEQLELELTITNLTHDRTTEVEACLHSYFQVRDLTEIRIMGLEGLTYLDHVTHAGPIQETQSKLQIQSQTDRTYLNTAGPVEIHDPGFGRRIQISKWGSKSTIVWNPGTTQPLSDLGPGEHRRFVCVESGNVGQDRLLLAPGGSAKLGVRLSTETLS